MGTQAKLVERVAVVAAGDPTLVDNTTLTSDWASMSDFPRVAFVLNMGATDITVNAVLQEATDSSGTGAVAITGKLITELSATDDNKQAIIEVDASELTATFTHVAMVATAGDGTAGAFLSIVGLGIDGRDDPASANDVASVAEIIS